MDNYFINLWLNNPVIRNKVNELIDNNTIDKHMLLRLKDEVTDESNENTLRNTISDIKKHVIAAASAGKTSYTYITSNILSTSGKIYNRFCDNLQLIFVGCKINFVEKMSKKELLVGSYRLMEISIDWS